MRPRGPGFWAGRKNRDWIVPLRPVAEQTVLRWLAQPDGLSGYSHGARPAGAETQGLTVKESALSAIFAAAISQREIQFANRAIRGADGVSFMATFS